LKPGDRVRVVDGWRTFYGIVRRWPFSLRKPRTWFGWTSRVAVELPERSGVVRAVPRQFARVVARRNGGAL